MSGKKSASSMLEPCTQDHPSACFPGPTTPAFPSFLPARCIHRSMSGGPARPTCSCMTGGFDVDPYEYICSKPCVLRTEEGYVMWVNTYGTTYRVPRLVRRDGLTWPWTKRLGPEGELGVGVKGSFDDEQRSYPCVVAPANMFHCWYTGNAFGRTGTGYASDSTDLVRIDVDAAAPDVSGWKPGDRVMALLAGGGYAEEVVVDAGSALRVPEGMDLEEAAGFPEVFLTVFLNCFQIGGLNKGDALLVHGGGSGIGTAAIQLMLRKCSRR